MRRLLLAAATAMFPFTAHADTIPGSTAFAGKWQISAYTRDGTQLFSHCAVGTNYTDGTVLVFAIDADQNSWRLGLMNERWDLPEGQSYPLAYFVDGDQPIHAQARVATRKLIVYELPPTAALFTRIRKGRTLYISAQGGLLSFDLTSSSKALSMGLGCAQTYQSASLGTGRSNPFASVVNASPDDREVLAVDSDVMRKEASKTILAGLSFLGIKDYQVMEPTTELRPLFHSVFWAPKAIGGFTILPNVQAAEAITFAMNTASSSCGSDSFVSGRKVVADGVTQITTACKKGDTQKQVDYLVGERKASGSVLMTITYGDYVNNLNPEQNSNVIGADWRPLERKP